MAPRRLASMRDKPSRGDIDPNTEPTSCLEDEKERALRVEKYLKLVEQGKPVFEKRKSSRR